MKKTLTALAGLFCLFFISCASNSFGSLCEFPVIDSGDLASGRYVVMGEVSGTSYISMTNDEYNKLIKNEFSYDPQNISVKFENDTATYGFIGKPANIKLNVFERAAALAEYDLIQNAKYNEADAIACLKSETTVSADYHRTTVKTVVSGFAVKVKADSGYTIKQRPVAAPAAPSVPEAEAEAADETDEVEGSDAAEISD